MSRKESLGGVLAQAAAYKKKRQGEPSFFDFNFTYPADELTSFSQIEDGSHDLVEVRVVEPSGQRGMHAKRNIKAGEWLVVSQPVAAYWDAENDAELLRNSESDVPSRGGAMTRRSWNLQIRLTSSAARRVTVIPSERESWCCVCSRRSRDVHRFGRTRSRRCTLAAWPRHRSYRPGAAVTHLLDPESGRKWRGSPCFPSLILKMKSRAIKSHCVFL
ncbi:hypothetical protein THAOC_01449 [Thalassiosira oceanica]|uniref:Uncharacterized protein n=1 Tax=Thalassiosira oceanica TaxID=159749 RepID=K0TID8_THAOC|nr:hypothetical protein THAOC_01449 [Thalassiosira oceanica]|eukprot:EJK76774.1 hypothetical protein THAOC_01449 [Thalassiosira oceanica]